MSIQLAFDQIRKNKICVQTDLLLKNHSSFRIGGSCALAVFPRSVEELKTAVLILNDLGVRNKVIGRASNIVFADRGYDGALIFTEKLKNICFDTENSIYAEAGASMKSAANFAASNGLSGLEFAHGIPGSCGGGVFMNAGAYGGEISKILVFSDCYNVKTGEIVRLNSADHKFSYRHSVFSEDRDLIILGSCFALIPAPVESIKELMRSNMKKRKEKQPLEYPNGGSAFKRPPNAFAAQMIDECGLKGTSVGDAEVSQKHAGFIINKGEATAKDVSELMDIIVAEVLEKYGVRLESELEFVE